MRNDASRLWMDETEWLYAPDEVYARRAGVTLKMQLIFPYRQAWAADERFPVVVYIPGAAWYQQEMYNSVPQWAKLAERGMVVAAVQVRASTEACFPAQTTDVMDAIRALASDAARWHIDPHRMYLMGASSGGHLALMTMLMRMQELAQAPDFTLRGVIAQSAPTDLWRCGEKPTLDLLGLRQLSDDPDAVRAASCGAYIRREVPLPRIMLMHGMVDDVVPLEHSALLHRQLIAAGKSVRFIKMNGVGHGGAAFWQEQALDSVAAFVLEA